MWMKVGRPTSLDDPRRQDISTFYGDNVSRKGPLGQSVWAPRHFKMG